MSRSGIALNDLAQVVFFPRSRDFFHGPVFSKTRRLYVDLRSHRRCPADGFSVSRLFGLWAFRFPAFLVSSFLVSVTFRFLLVLVEALIRSESKFCCRGILVGFPEAGLNDLLTPYSCTAAALAIRGNSLKMQWNRCSHGRQYPLDSVACVT